MDDPELKIQTFRPTWEEFKDFKKYIQYIESRGAHKAGLARIIPPPEFVPRRQGYNDLTKLKVIIKKPICQAVANVKNRPGVYQQVNVPLKAMTVTDFKNLANSEKYRPPPHSSYKELEEIYWSKITSHAGIYGADVCGSITDPDYPYWNINKLDTILDYVGKDYDISIDGVNTAYMYFGMWKTTFGWHTEDMDLYSINYLHFGAPKSWYSIPPCYGRKFEKLCAALFPNSYKSCRAFLRHKMTVINPKWLDDYSIPYDRVTQEAGHIMITFPYGYHAGFNHGFNCAESTNFTTERWIEYGKHATLCYCCPDSVKFPMDTFVKRFQPHLFDAFKARNDNSQHPEYRLNPMEINEPTTVYNKQMSFLERNPDLDLQDLIENPYLQQEIKDELKNSYFVSAEDEVAEMEAEYDHRMSIRQKKGYGDIESDFDSDEEKPLKRRRKKHDSDYDDDWYEKTGKQLVSEDGKFVKKLGRPPGKRGRPAKNQNLNVSTPAKKTEFGSANKNQPPQVTVTQSKSINTDEPKKPVVAIKYPSEGKNSLESSPPIAIGPNAKVAVLGSKEKTVMVMTGKPGEVPIPQPKSAGAIGAPIQKGPSYNDAFAQFLQQANKTPKPKPPPQTQPESQPVSVIQETPKSNRGRRKKQDTTSEVQTIQTQQPKIQAIVQPQDQPQIIQNQSNIVAQNQKVKTERIPQSQPYAIQENTVLTQDGKQQKLYYTILNTPNTGSNFQQQIKMNANYGLYGQQSF